MHTGKDPSLFTFAYLDTITGDSAAILTSGDRRQACDVAVEKRTTDIPGLSAR